MATPTNVQNLLLALRELEDCEYLIVQGLMAANDPVYTAALQAVQQAQTAAGNAVKPVQ